MTPAHDPKPGEQGPLAYPAKLYFLTCFGFFRSLEKFVWAGPKWGREVLFPANPDLADILGRTDLGFGNFSV